MHSVHILRFQPFYLALNRAPTMHGPSQTVHGFVLAPKKVMYTCKCTHCLLFAEIVYTYVHFNHRKRIMLTKKYDYNAKYANNSSGIRGVSYDKTKKKWEVKFQYRGRRTRLGFFDTIIEAAAARERFVEETAKWRFDAETADRTPTNCYQGVVYDLQKNLWTVACVIYGRREQVGCFDTFEEALDAFTNSLETIENAEKYGEQIQAIPEEAMLQIGPVPTSIRTFVCDEE